jgi:trk system potassium uptake protein TrkA
MKKNYIVIGVGRFGRAIALTLTQAGCEVMVIDNDLREIELIKDEVAHALCVDVTDETAMKALELDRADVIIVAIGEDQHASVFATAILKQLGVRNIIARAMSRLHGQILKQVGANRIIYVEEQMGEELAKRLLAPHILERFDLPDDIVMVEVEAPKTFVGKTLNELQVRTKFGVFVLALKKQTPSIDPEGNNTFVEKVLRFPGPDVQIDAGHIMMIVGASEDIEAFISKWQ